MRRMRPRGKGALGRRAIAHHPDLFDYSWAEEVVHCITHGLGAVFSIAGLVLLVLAARETGNPLTLAAATVYGLSLVFCYVSSALYHGVTLGGTSWNKGKRHPTLLAGVVIGAGAKILGPITLHEGAKVGSNAVVVRDVPAGATAVGIPARIIDAEKEQVREQKAETMGFSAYAVTTNQDDPLAKAIHGLLDHAVETDKRIERLLAQLEKAGVPVEDERAMADKFDPNYLGKIVD